MITRSVSQRLTLVTIKSSNDSAAAGKVGASTYLWITEVSIAENDTDEGWIPVASKGRGGGSITSMSRLVPLTT